MKLGIRLVLVATALTTAAGCDGGGAPSPVVAPTSTETAGAATTSAPSLNQSSTVVDSAPATTGAGDPADCSVRSQPEVAVGSGSSTLQIVTPTGETVEVAANDPAFRLDEVALLPGAIVRRVPGNVIEVVDARTGDARGSAAGTDFEVSADCTVIVYAETSVTALAIDGSTTWSRNTSGWAFMNRYGHRDVVGLPTGDGVQIVEAATGVPLWDSRADSEISGFVGDAFVINSGGMQFYDRHSGDLMSLFDFTDGPHIVGDTAVLGWNGDSALIYDYTSGELVGRLSNGSSSYFILPKGVAYVDDAANLQFIPVDGSSPWAARLDPELGVNDVASVDGVAVIVLGPGGETSAMDATTGSVKWVVDSENENSWVESYRGNTLIVSDTATVILDSSGAEVVRLDGRVGGYPVFHRSSDDSGTAGYGAGPHGIVVYEEENPSGIAELVAVDAQTGSELWRVLAADD